MSQTSTAPFSTLYKEIDYSLVEHQIDILHLQQRIFVTVTIKLHQSDTTGDVPAEQLELLPGQGLSAPVCHPATSSRKEQGSHGNPGSSPTSDLDLLFCITSVTQPMPLPAVFKPWAIALTCLGPSWWHQLDSKLQHQKARGSFTVSGSRQALTHVLYEPCCAETHRNEKML